MRLQLWLPVLLLTACGGNVILDHGGGSSSGAAGATGAGGGGPATTSVGAGGATSGGGSGGTTTGAPVSSSFAASVSSTVTTVGSGPPPCNPCGAVFQGADPLSVCPGMEVDLLKTMEVCVCQSTCAMPCVDLCTANGPISQQCQACTIDSAGGGCFMQVQACLHEM